MVEKSRISIPKEILEEVKYFIKNNPFYDNYSEFIKFAIKEKLDREKNDCYKTSLKEYEYGTDEYKKKEEELFDRFHKLLEI